MAYKRAQIAMVIAVGILQTVDVQFMYPAQQPVYMMPAPPPPPPVPVPMPFPVPVPYRVTEKPTTTTTKKPEEDEGRIAIPFAVPMPVPYAVPAAPPPMFCVSKPRAPGCPPCPPCSCKPVCTPAFFSYCSPCHQLCRCRYGAPMPLPPVYPPPQQPAVVVVPFPPPLPRFPPEERECDRKIRIGRSSTETESSTETDDDYSESSSSSDSAWFRNGQVKGHRKHKKSHKKRRSRPKFMKKRQFMRNHRKFLSDPDSSNVGDSNLVKPVFAYISEDGKVVFHQKINDEDAARLMSKNSYFEDEQRNLQQFINEKSGRRMVETKEITGQNKKVIFKTPPNKRVSNLSVSFSLF